MWFLISVVFIFSLPFFLILNSDLSPSVFSQNHDLKALASKGNKISGSLIAKSNYLSIVTIYFDPSNEISGTSVFKIRERGRRNWYYNGSIDSRQYHYYPKYAFGFPPISKSKDKIYEFEIEFANQYENIGPLQLDPNKTMFTSQYKYPVKVLLSNHSTLLSFALNKIKYSLTQESAKQFINIGFHTFALFSILLLTLSRLPLNLRLSLHAEFIFLKNNITLFILFLYLVDVFIINSYIGTIVYFAIAIWIVQIRLYRYHSEKSIAMGCIFLVFCLLLNNVGLISLVEKSAMWSFFMLSIGVFQCFIDLKTSIR